jgi:type VI secretion system protein ImpK
MTGDSDDIGRAGAGSRFSGAGGAEPSTEGSDSTPKPLRGWASVYEPAPPSMWTRVRASVVRLFGRKHNGSADATETRATGESAPVTPPPDFSFPWTRETGDRASAEREPQSSFSPAPPFAPQDETPFSSVNAALPMLDMIPPDDLSAATVEVDLDADTDEFTVPAPQPPSVDAAAEAERPPFFVPKFRAFYNEIVLYKHQKSEFTAGFATAIMDQQSEAATPDEAAQALSKRLQEILELQSAEAMWMGGEAASRYPDAQYAMAVLADEMFTHADWPGRDAWPNYSLEQKFFRSSFAEIQFFKRVDKLLKDSAAAPTRGARDLARLYLLVLASGFQGKYREPKLKRPLAEYRRRLYEFVYGADPLMLYAEHRRIFPQALESTVVGRAVSRFTMLQRWAAVLAFIVVGYLVASQVTWSNVSADLEDVTARVEAANGSSTADGVAAPNSASLPPR